MIQMYKKMIKKIKHLIAGIFYYSGLLNLILYFFRKILKKGSFTILTYHRISDDNFSDPHICVSPYNFEKQLQYLKKRYEIISLGELVKRILSENTPSEEYVAITFDDGYKDIYTNAYPLLNEYKVPATIFLTTGFIGTDKLFWWDRVARIITAIISKKLLVELPPDIYPKEVKDLILKISSGGISNSSEAITALSVLLKKISQTNRDFILNSLENQILPLLSNNENRPFPLTWEEVRQMSENGIESGSHTITHPILTSVKRDQAEHEILHSKTEIEQKIGKKVMHFCYPNGEKTDFDEQIIQFVKDNGYISACSTINGANYLYGDVFSLKRRDVNNVPIYVFAVKITGIADFY